MADGKISCCIENQKMERFMEICLLLLLSEAAGHGYALKEQLGFFGFSEEQINISTLYRSLRKMEKAGAVVSIWEQGGQGPKRRTYKITVKGKEELAQWVQVLKGRKARIEKLIQRYESSH